MIATTALLCMSLTVWAESRGEPVKGQQAVALTVANRADWKPENVCKVVFKPKAFSYTNNLRALRVDDSESFFKAIAISDKVLTGHTKNFLGKNVKHYCTTSVHPKWADNKKKVAVIGHHKFFAGVA